MRVWLVLGVVGLNALHYIVPLVYHRRVLLDDPTWLSYATRLDLLAIRETLPMYAFSLLMLTATGAGVLHRVYRMRALLDAPRPEEYLCVGLSIAFSVLLVPGGVDRGLQWMLIPALFNFGVVVSYPCRGPARLRPSSLSLWIAGALFTTQMTSGASNVGGRPPCCTAELETLHQMSCFLSFALGFPMLACIRTHLVAASLLSALALLALFSVTLDLEGRAGAVQPQYFAEFVGHTALLLATVLGTTRMVE